MIISRQFLFLTLISPLVILAGTSKSKVTLRNGGRASQERVEHVYTILQKLHKKERYKGYYWLWRTASLCKELRKKDCILEELFQEADKHYLIPLDSQTLTFLESNGIIHNGILDQETQDIIISSYFGSMDPKIVGIEYPVPSFAEKYIPFARAVQVIYRLLA